MRKLFLFILLAFSLSSCTYYQTGPATYSSTPVSNYDRAWSAAINAFNEQNIIISEQDKISGVIKGSKNGNRATGSVIRLADGRVKVQFNTENNDQLNQAISHSYNHWMGR